MSEYSRKQCNPGGHFWASVTKSPGCLFDPSISPPFSHLFWRPSHVVGGMATDRNSREDPWDWAASPSTLTSSPAVTSTCTLSIAITLSLKWNGPVTTVSGDRNRDLGFSQEFTLEQLVWEMGYSSPVLSPPSSSLCKFPSGEASESRF